MDQYKGWQIVLGFLGAIAIINLFTPLLNKIELEQGTLTALLILGVIIYLLFKDFKL